MTIELRDHFAGLAMQAIISNENLRQEMCNKASKHLNDKIDAGFALGVYAQGAYLIADAMLEARKENV